MPEIIKSKEGKSLYVHWTRKRWKTFEEMAGVYEVLSVEVLDNGWFKSTLPDGKQVMDLLTKGMHFFILENDPAIYMPPNGKVVRSWFA